MKGLIKLTKEDERRIRLQQKYEKMRRENEAKHPHDPSKKHYEKI